MAVKHKNLFLFLALSCFVGIILIFIFDGYIGVYDRLVIDNNQYVQTVEGDQWPQQERFGGIVSVSVERGGRVDFTYTVENHRLSEYSETVEVSLWSNKVKIADLLSQHISIPAFDEENVTWSINTDDIIPAGFPDEQNYTFNIRIIRGDIEREINIYVYPSAAAIKTIPIPVP